jgi:uncharacterized protein
LISYFADSSALTKRYLVEPGTDWMRSITSGSTGNKILIAQITPAEVVSAVARRPRVGEIPPRTARAIRLLIDRHPDREYIIIGLTRAIVQKAENLLKTHALRAYDAVQLATLIETNLRLSVGGLMPLTFVSSDERLLTVAIAEGVATENPVDRTL